MNLSTKVIHCGLKWICLCGNVLCRLYVPRVFGTRTGFHVDSTHIFPQCMRAAITVLGVWLLLEDLKPAQGVKRDFLLCTVGVLSGVESAPQLPEKSPECQDWAGFVPFDCMFCPKGGECWNKWVSRAHRGLRHCLCRHLQLHPNTPLRCSPGLHSFPYLVIQI